MSVNAQALDQATEDAITWLVLLRSGEATAADRSAFDGWLTRAPQHQNAWQRLAGPVDGAFAAARSIGQRSMRTSRQADNSAPVHADLSGLNGLSEVLAQTIANSANHALRRRRMLRGALAVGGVGVGTALIAQRFTPLQESFADLRTGTGERRRFTLPDGSTLLLNARSAVDVAFSGGQRTVHLRSGEAIAEIRADALLPTRFPFMLQCRQGQVRAETSASRFLLRQEADRSLAVALEGQLELAAAGARQTLAPGDAAWLTSSGINPAPGFATTAMAWQQGLVTVNDQALGDVISALRPYRRGLIRIAPEAANLRVYGSYPLDDTDRALASMGETLPVKVHVHSAGWLVRIEMA